MRGKIISLGARSESKGEGKLTGKITRQGKEKTIHWRIILKNFRRHFEYLGLLIASPRSRTITVNFLISILLLLISESLSRRLLKEAAFKVTRKQTPRR